MALDTLGWLAALVVVIVVAGTAAWAGWRAAPYVPTRQRDVERLLQLANIQRNDIVYDLGAGDGRFVITAAQRYGVRAVGYEISVLPYLVSLLRIRLSGVRALASMRFQDFYRQPLHEASVVVCFLTPGAMARLAPKFQRELRPGTRVLSYAFAIAGWTPDIKDKPNPQTMSVYVYTVKAEH